MRAWVVLVLALIAPPPAGAQTRPFSCLGAEQLEDDVFVLPFTRDSASVGEAARSALAAALELARSVPERNLCVLGHAGQEGGAVTSTRLAARRAGAVADMLAQQGVTRDRIRAEARGARFSARARAAEPPSRTVTVVVMPP